MPSIFDSAGNIVPPQDIARVRARALVGGGIAPYDAADRVSAEMASWTPWLGSPDGETTPYRDAAVARLRDLIRNDGWASGTVTRTLDAVVGADLRVSSQPDYRALARRWPGVAFDAVWAREYGEAAEAAWRSWGYDPGRWCDLQRRLLWPQIARLAFRHYLVEGEAIAVLPWRDDRRGYGRARYATALDLIDPDRLSNPNMRTDARDLRGGIELDPDGVPVAFHIRRAHQNDWFVGSQGWTWERVARETDFGRPQVVHFFDMERAGQHRPVGGIFAPVLARMRMLAQYDRVELQAAIVNAIFGAYVESPFDSDDVQEAMQDQDQLSTYQKMRSDFWQDTRMSSGNVRLAKLFPGERINTIQSTRPNSAFDAFEGAMLRNIATSVGLPYETVSADYRGSSYSSARQSMLEAWRTLHRRRMDFGYGFVAPIFGAVLEEAIDRADVPLPAGAPEFPEIRAELSRIKVIGPGRGWIDPVKEVEGAKARIAAGLSTMEAEMAEQSGVDLEETLDQRAIEQRMLAERGLVADFGKGGSKPAGDDGNDAGDGATPPKPGEGEGNSAESAAE